MKEVKIKIQYIGLLDIDLAKHFFDSADFGDISYCAVALEGGDYETEDFLNKLRGGVISELGDYLIEDEDVKNSSIFFEDGFQMDFLKNKAGRNHLHYFGCSLE